MTRGAQGQGQRFRLAKAAWEEQIVERAMHTALIGDYEVTITPGGEPALEIFHVVRGHTVVALGSADAGALRDLLATEQKRIRELAGYQLIFGAGGDLTFYSPNGTRACYLRADHAATLARYLRETGT